MGYTAKEISLLPAVGLTVKGVEAVVFRLTRYVRERLQGKDPERMIELPCFHRFRDGKRFHAGFYRLRN